MTERRPRSFRPSGRCGCGSACRQWDRSCSCGNLLPARLDQARDLPAQRDFAQLVAPEPELAKLSARAAGQAATAPEPNRRGVPRQLLLLLARLLAILVGAPGVVDDSEQRSASGGVLCHRLAAFLVAVDQGEFGHGDPSGLERKAKGGEQRARLIVVFSGRGDADVEPAQGVDLVVFDFRKNDLLLDAEAVVAAAVERAARDAAEVTDTRDCHGDQPIQELVHALATQGHHAPDRISLADLERRDRLLGLGDHGFLAGDLGEIGNGVVQDLLVRRRLAHAHIQRDLLDARYFHRGLVPELLHEVGHDVLAVIVLQAGHRQVSVLVNQASTISPLDLNTRTLRPSSISLKPIRSAFLVCGLNSATLEMSIGMSLSTMPPVKPFMGLGRWCFLTRLTPSTTRCLASTIRSTVPRLPLSLPAVTMTASPFLIFSIALSVAAGGSQTFGARPNIFLKGAGVSFRGPGPNKAGAHRSQFCLTIQRAVGC